MDILSVSRPRRARLSLSFTATATPTPARSAWLPSILRSSMGPRACLCIPRVVDHLSLLARWRAGGLPDWSCAAVGLGLLGAVWCGALPLLWRCADPLASVPLVLFAFFQFVFAFMLHIFGLSLSLCLLWIHNHSRAVRRPFVGAGRLASSSAFRQILLTTTIVQSLVTLQ